ncbi:hypothetical protein M0R45_029526 [Rubus argutus]|uniref:Uncharacterized protein n=1 Tax=Rubus argutus TaxID=59490 RepID=A0AAW1W8B9_RUBAR
MAMVTASAHFSPKPSSPLPRTYAFPSIPTASSRCFFPSALGPAILPSRRRALFCPVIKSKISQDVDCVEEAEQQQIQVEKPNETLLYSNLLPLLFLAALPGAGAVTSLFDPFVELVKSFNLPGWLVHWGHPGNMAVVLFAMGGYGSYLGYRIRYSDDVEEKAKAKDLHPKLLAGMFFFFAAGATGGVTALLTSDKPIFESSHAVTGFIGLGLLTIQTILPSLFEGNPNLRSVHGVLGTGIMTLFVVHAALGLQLGLSF